MTGATASLLVNARSDPNMFVEKSLGDMIEPFAYRSDKEFHRVMFSPV